MTLKNIALTVCTGIDISQVKRTESGSSVCYKHREVDDFGSFTGTAVSQKRLQSATIDLIFNSWTDSKAKHSPHSPATRGKWGKFLSS